MRLRQKTEILSQSILRKGPFSGPNFGPQNGVHLGWSFLCRRVENFFYQQVAELHWHGWLRVSRFCLAVTRIAAASFAFLRTVRVLMVAGSKLILKDGTRQGHARFNNLLGRLRAAESDIVTK